MSGTLCTAPKGMISILKKHTKKKKKLMPGPAPPLRASPSEPRTFLHLPGGLPTGALKEPKLQKLKLGKQPQNPKKGQSVRSSPDAEKKKLCPVYFSPSPTSLQAHHFPRVLVS